MMSVVVLSVVAPMEGIQSLSIKENEWNNEAGNTNRKGMVSTVDLLIKVACFVKKINKISNRKSI
jgi:hypothetical protein